MEQLVILLLIALISIINWIIQKSKERREKRKLEKRADATGEPVAKGEPAPDATGTETAMRRLREALGLPDEAPPPVIPKRAEPKRVEAERIEPKRMEPKRGERPVSVPAPSPDRVVPPPLPQPERRPIVVHTPPVPRWQAHRRSGVLHKIAKPPLPEVSKQSPRIRELLQSQGGLRDAVVLSEILGPPKSLRERSLPS
jgi:hypothetical protein